MLQIKNLTIFLREDYRTIIEDFTFSLSPGDKVGLIGEEGNGKSILLKTIFDRQRVEEYCDVRGDINKKGEIIAYLPQVMEDEYLELNSQDYIKSRLANRDFDYNVFYKYLNQFNLEEAVLSDDFKLKNLSGGEKIKFILLVEMLKEPSLILMDEPSNDLDLDSVLWLEDFMMEIDIPLIFVSHDSKLLSKVANKIIHLELIQRRTKTKYTVASTGYDEYISTRADFIETQTQRSRKDHEIFDKKVERYRRIHDSVQSALRATKNDSVGKNLKDKMHSVKSMGRSLEREKEKLTREPDFEDSISIFFDESIRVANGKEILDLNLEELRAGKKFLAKNIKLKIIGPEKICIVGENGVGKTTLIKIIMEELEKLNLKVGYMPQTYFQLENYDITAIEYLSKTFTKDEHTQISLYLGSLNFKREEMYRKIGNLSGGQKAKLFFAKMNLDRAEVLLLDEPTRNLSPSSQPEIIEALQDYKGVIISISHDRNFIEEVCEIVYELTDSGLKERLLKK